MQEIEPRSPASLGSTHPPPPSQGPSGWWAAIDNKSGRMYYYNRRTAETMWTLPDGLTKDMIKMNTKSFGGNGGFDASQESGTTTM